MRLEEILQVEIHQASFFASVFLGKEPKAVAFVKAGGGSKSINGEEAAACAVAMSKDIFYTVKNPSSDTHPCIILTYCQTTYFYGWVMIAMLMERNFSIDTVAHFFFRLIQANYIVEQTVIGHDTLVLWVYKKVGHSKKFCLIVFCLIKQEVVQIRFFALKWCKIYIRSEQSDRYVGQIHRKSGQSGELRLKASYANLARSFSSSETGEGWSMCQRKRSASAPVSTGVSLMGLAIVLFLSFMIQAAKIQIKIETTNKYGAKE